MRGPKPKPSPAPTNGRDDSGRFRRGQAPKPAPKPPLIVQRVGLHTIHEDPSNANRHPEEDITDLMAKLSTFPQVEPLVVQLSTRKVIGGNGRLEAMRRLGWVECDVTFIDCDNVTATALGISLNRRKSYFDDADLVAQLKAIQSENPDLMAAVGYDGAELDRLIKSLSMPTDGDWAGAFEQAGDTSAVDGQVQVTFVLASEDHGSLMAHLVTLDPNKNVAIVKWLSSSGR